MPGCVPKDDLCRENDFPGSFSMKMKTGEAVGYSADGKFIVATTEGKNPPVIEVDRK